MEIIYHGHACFSLKSKKATIATDPFKDVAGIKAPKAISADIVTCSNETDNHHNTDLTKDAYLVDWPGEYDKQDVVIEGMDIPLKDSEEKSTIFVITTEGLNICHLGTINQEPSAEVMEQLQNVDILLIPVGGAALSPKDARTLAEKIEARITIPMDIDASGAEAEFAKEMGVADAPESSYKIAKKDLPVDKSVTIRLAAK